MERICVAAMLVALAACSGDSSDTRDWPGTVEADVDDLTGQRTGLFRTYGPTSLIVAGPDTVPVTVGYWCQVNEAEGEPLTVVDGMFLKVSLPDTSLTSSGAEAFEELRGTLGLLDLARMAVDGNVSAWRYDAKPELGAWYLDGVMGFVPDQEIDSREEREAFSSVVDVGYGLAGDLAETSPSLRVLQPMLYGANEAVMELRAAWSPATDYVGSHYFGRDTLGVELKGVVKFSLDGFSAAADSVRFWCPAPQSHHEWNAMRTAFFGRIDSLQTAYDDRVMAMQQERVRQEAAGRAERERARIAAEAREDSISAEHAVRRARSDSIARAQLARQDSINARYDSLGIRVVMDTGAFAAERMAIAFVEWAGVNNLPPINSPESLKSACLAEPPADAGQSDCQRYIDRTELNVLRTAGGFSVSRIAIFIEWANANGLGPILDHSDLVMACLAEPPADAGQSGCQQYIDRTQLNVLRAAGFPTSLVRTAFLEWANANGLGPILDHDGLVRACQSPPRGAMRSACQQIRRES